MPVIKVKEEDHNLIRSYCAINQIKITSFMENIIQSNKELKDFRDSLEVLKFKG